MPEITAIELSQSQLEAVHRKAKDAGLSDAAALSMALANYLQTTVKEDKANELIRQMDSIVKQLQTLSYGVYCVVSHQMNGRLEEIRFGGAAKCLH